jgi:hypothetical protein
MEIRDETSFVANYLMQNEILKKYSLHMDEEALEYAFQNLHSLEQCCNICLEFFSSNEYPVYPCRCVYFKIHVGCVPQEAYRCGQCSTFYGKRLDPWYLRLFLLHQCRGVVKRFKDGRYRLQRCEKVRFMTNFCGEHRE